MRTESMPSEFAEYARRDLVLPEGMRAELATPLGRIYRGSELVSALRGAKPLVAVGDVVTAELLTAGRTPDVAIIDFRTKRRDDPGVRGKLAALGPSVVRVANPAGGITAAAWAAILEAFKSSDRVRVEVHGEEDLLALVAIALAPDGAAVVYGQPDEGAVVVHVSGAARARVRSILARMQ